MASLLGSHMPVDCPVCRDVVNVPVTETGREGSLVTFTVDTRPFREHIADHKPTGEKP